MIPYNSKCVKVYFIYMKYLTIKEEEKQKGGPNPEKTSKKHPSMRTILNCVYPVNHCIHIAWSKLSLNEWVGECVIPLRVPPYTLYLRCEGTPWIPPLFCQSVEQWIETLLGTFCMSSGLGYNPSRKLYFKQNVLA